MEEPAFLEANEQMRLESNPPESKKPWFVASLPWFMRRRVASCRSERIVSLASARSGTVVRLGGSQYVR